MDGPDNLDINAGMHSIAYIFMSASVSQRSKSFCKSEINDNDMRSSEYTELGHHVATSNNAKITCRQLKATNSAMHQPRSFIEKLGGQSLKEMLDLH